MPRYPLSLPTCESHLSATDKRLCVHHAGHDATNPVDWILRRDALIDANVPL